MKSGKKRLKIITMKNLFYLNWLIIITVICNSCSKQNYNKINLTGELKFEFSSSENNLKSVNDENVSAVIISVADAGGNSVIEMKKLTLLDFNGEYITEPISLPVGEYLLTTFLVINQDAEVIYATPEQNSEIGKIISDPLPVTFIINNNEVTRLIPQVVKTNDYKAEDFGFSTFSFEITEIQPVKIAAFVYDSLQKNLILTDAVLIIQYPDNTIKYQLENIVNDINFVKSTTYQITFSKEGYKNIDTSFTFDDIETSLYDPIKIVFIETEIKSEHRILNPIAYYPCNGDGEEIINQYHAVTENLTVGTDRFNRPEMAMEWDGKGLEFFNVPISEFGFADIFTKNGAISFWFKAQPEIMQSAILLSSCQNINTSHLGPRLTTLINSGDSLNLSFYHKHPDALNKGNVYLYPSDKWHNVILNWDTSKIEFYVDAQPIMFSEKRNFNGNVYLSEFMSFGAFILDNEVSNANYIGLIDDILFFDYTLEGWDIINALEYGTPIE